MNNILRFIVMQGLVILGVGVSWHFAGFRPEILTALLLGYLFGVISEFTRPFKK